MSFWSFLFGARKAPARATYSATLNKGYTTVISKREGEADRQYRGSCTVWRRHPTGAVVGNYDLIDALGAAEARAKWEEGQ